MKFDKPIPLKTIAIQIGTTEIIGNDMGNVLGINEIHHVRAGDITFSDVKKYFEKALKSAATFIILNEKPDHTPEGKTVLIHPKPFDAFDIIVRQHRPFIPLSIEVADNAVIHPSVIIEPRVIIGNHVKIGAGSYIRANAFIDDNTVIGKNVVVGVGAIIGTDAFYFNKNMAHPDEIGTVGYRKWRSGGRVVIEDNVDIGAACTINRGVSSDTIIGAGTKLDCQVHIGHDTIIGKNCLVAAQTGISGNSKIGDNSIIYGQVGIAQNIEIGEKAIVLGQSGVTKSIEGGKTYFGTPAQDIKDAYKELALLRQLRKK